MSAIRSLFLSLLIIGSAGLLVAEEATDTMPAPVLLELFTSEGCSSCPPVSDFLGQVGGKAREQNAPVYCLAWHVDYWDQLGWKDAYADPAYVKRQKRYSETLRLRGLATPQVIMNGHQVLGGVGLRNIMDFLENGFAQPKSAIMAIEQREPGDDAVAVTVVVKGLLNGLKLNAAVAERDLTTEVTAGENKGKTLTHHCTVRGFAAASLSQEDIGESPAGKQAGMITVRQTIAVPLPENVDRDKTQVVVFLQDPKTMRVIASHGVPLVAEQTPAAGDDAPAEAEEVEEASEAAE
ncbi:MAG: DUF1223 domain-containing protein [Planctomycetota bacterium]